MADLRIFVECTTKAVFDARLEAGDITARHLVLIKSTNQLYHNGVYYGLSAADAEKLAAVYARNEFGEISDGTNHYAATKAEDTLTIQGSGSVSVTASSTGFTVTGPTLVEGDGNGQIKFNGTNVDVHGLGSAAYTDSTAYATSTQGSNSDTHIANTNNPHSVTAAQVGLGNVTNESKATMFTSPEFTGTPIATTAAVGTNTTQIATTAFVKAEIDDVLAAADAMVFKGIVDLTTHPLPSTYTLGWTYVVNEAGTYAGQVCEVGDMIIAKKTVTSSGTPSNNDWAVVQTNINGAVTGPASSVDNQVAIFNGTSGKVIKDSGFTIGASVPADAEFTDTTYTFSSGANGSFSVTEEGGSAQTISIGKPATAGTADEVAHDLSITLGSGGTAQTFDGSADLSVTVTPSAIGAAEASHTHTADEVTAMGTVSAPYTKPSSVAAAISTNDSLQTAIGKLEAMFDWVTYSTTE